MTKLQSTLPFFNGEATITIEFYQSNGMPALQLENAQNEVVDILTVNHHMYFDKAISIRSDDKDKVKRLYNAGWIQSDPFVRIPSGFISIDYYKLTTPAYKAIKTEAKKRKLTYPSTEKNL